MAHKKKGEEKKGAPEYMLTYGDMMTLLLCFFVMLLAMSTIDPNKFMVASSSFQNAFSGVLESLPNILITKEIIVPQLGGDEQNKRMAIEAVKTLRENLKKDNVEEGVKVKVTDTGIAVKIADPVGFDVGSSEIKPQFRKILMNLLDVIKDKPNAEIRVEGHTDDTPISTAQFPSNWELSASRALTVVKFMHENLGADPRNLSGVGYGQYRPVAPNDTPANKQKNRRIEIFIEYLEKKDTPQS